MRKIVRPTYPAQFSIGLLSLVFVIVCFLSHQIFDVSIHDLSEHKSVYFGMFLVGVAAITMVLIIWEEFLFPIKVKEISGGMIFRNHRTKLKTQLLIYFLIPAIFTFIYFEYDIRPVRFFIWAAICIIAPIVEKIASGINNYNDFLKLTDEEIEYKNNEKEGAFKTKNIQSINIRKEGGIIEKIQLSFIDGSNVIIDLDEMELDAFYESIDKFVADHYRHLLNTSSAVQIN